MGVSDAAGPVASVAVVARDVVPGAEEEEEEEEEDNDGLAVAVAHRTEVGMALDVSERNVLNVLIDGQVCNWGQRRVLFLPSEVEHLDKVCL